MVAQQAAADWAKEEFGHAQLGNKLRTARLVKMATRVANGPAGLVTRVFRTARERVGAYRFVENAAICVERMVASSALATIRRAQDGWVFVPVDGSSLTLADPKLRRGLGSVGSYLKKGRGLKVMSSIGVSPDGTPLGLLDLLWWTRETVPERKETRTKRRIDQKETRYWLQVIQRVRDAFAKAKTLAVPWFQLDREGDFREMLESIANMADCRVTVRAASNRKLATGEVGYLWDDLLRQAPGGTYGLPVASGPQRQARTARMTVRWARVTLQLRNQRHSSRDPRTSVTLWAVLALESGTTPPNESPLQWMMLTNAAITDHYEACEVIYGYSLRWRIEEFHRAWKSQCDVEASQLHQVNPIQRWATLLAAAAMRIERLKHLGRNEPESPATVEFSREEIDAIIVLRQPKGVTQGETPSIGQAVRWVADLGGYIGPSNGPPGATVLGRGLQQVETAAIVLSNLNRPKPA